MELLKSLIEICSVPGSEESLRDFLIEQLRPYGTIVKTKWTGCYCARKNNRPERERKRVVISAHMDSPGFIVRDVFANGTLDIIPLGGISTAVLDVRSVYLYTSRKRFPGVLHLTSSDAKEVSCRGFFGFTSQNDAHKAGVKKGDSVCFHAPVSTLRNEFFAAPHLDDRLGVFLLVELAASLAKATLDCDVYFAATSCEEMGGRCASIIAAMIEPDLAICLDVTYAEGSVEMGKGPVITLSDAATFLPRKLRDALAKIAKQHKIPIQFEVYNYATTDARDYREGPAGCLALNTLIATSNNHSPQEICSLKDLRYTRRLVEALLKHHELLVI